MLTDVVERVIFELLLGAEKRLGISLDRAEDLLRLWRDWYECFLVTDLIDEDGCAEVIPSCILKEAETEGSDLKMLGIGLVVGYSFGHDETSAPEPHSIEFQPEAVLFCVEVTRPLRLGCLSRPETGKALTEIGGCDPSTVIFDPE